MRTRYGCLSLTSSTVLAAMIFACGPSQNVWFEDDCAGGACVDASTPFTSDDASGPAPASETPGMCPTKECPSGRTTCPINPYPCGVDLNTDNDNCGACSVHCPTDVELLTAGLGLLRAGTRCIEGACRLECIHDIEGEWADCNNNPDDGCEVLISADTNNCGACGDVCPPPYACVGGACACAPRTCGASCTVCPPAPKSPWPNEWHAQYACDGTNCNQPMCIVSAGIAWADCNADFLPLLPAPDPSGDGCEINLFADAKNCGACGKECGVGEVCNRGICVCPCGSPCFPQNRLDFDVDNCGSCGLRCPEQLDTNSERFCESGVCVTHCVPGSANCDGDTANGCETNVWNDPLNCGGCGVRCNGIDGQACIDGRCATEQCEVQR